MIPALQDGVLPEGVHDCTFAELEAAFGQFQGSDRRVTLTARLKAYLDEARRSGLVVAVIVDGSFVTAKDAPEDIDLIIVLKPDIDWDVLQPFKYNAVSKRVVKRAYRFDVNVHVEGDERYAEALDFFMRVNPDKHDSFTSCTRKGVLRIRP